MKTKMTMLGIVIAVFGCTVALAAAPSSASEAVTPSAAPAPQASPAANLEEDLVVALAKAVIGLSVLPAGR